MQSRGRVALGQIGGVGCELVGDDSDLDVVAVGEAEVLLGRDVAEHRGAVHGDHRGTDGRRDVVVGRRDVGGERAERVERRLVAPLLLQVHVLLDLVHGYVAGAFDHRLHVVAPRHLRQLAQRLQLGQLRLVVGVGDRPGPQPVAEGERDVVPREDLAQLREVGVQEVLLVVRQAPGGQQRAAARDDPGDPADRERDVPQQHPRMYRHVVHALLGLLDDGVPVHRPGQPGRVAADLLQRLVDGYRADGYRRVAQDRLAGLVDALAGGQVHHGVCAPPGRPLQLGDLFVHCGRHRRGTDVRVHLDQEPLTDDHRLALGVVEVDRQHRPAGGQLVEHQRDGYPFAQRHVLHLRGHQAGAGELQLGTGSPLGQPRLAHRRRR